MKKKECIFILGMHRSGTSALTGVLNLFGLEVGKNVISPAYDNPKGFFENKKVVDLNNKILNTLKIDWLTAFIPKYERLKADEVKDFKQAIKFILQSEFSEEDTFMIKDPRLCLVLPLWKSVLEELGITAKYLISTRNPIDISESLETRNGIPVSQSFMLWLNYVMQAELLTREEKRIFVNYEDLIINPVKETYRISEQLDIFSKIEIERHITTINSFIVADLQHHNAEIDQFEYLNLPSYYGEFYRLIKVLPKENANSSSIKSKIDKIRENHYKNILPFENTIDKVIPQVQFFFDTGKGFNETEAVRKLVYSVGPKKMSIDISSYKDIKSIRIDPLDCPCIIKVENIELTSGKTEIHNCLDYNTNASYEKDGTLFFDIFDSQLIIDLSDAKVSTFAHLNIEIDYRFLGLDALVIINEQNK